MRPTTGKPRRWRPSPLVAAAALASPAMVAPAPTFALSLTWDASATHPTAPLDGSGIWNAANNPVWTTGSANVPWVDGSDVTVGTATGSAAYTIGLAANVSTGTVEFDPAGPGASYTLNANGKTLATPAANWSVTGVPLTLTNGTFTVGDAAANPQAIVVGAGGSLTLGPGATLAVAVLSGDIYDPPHTTYFNGGTLRPLSTQYTVLSGFSAEYLSAGGLTIDNGSVAAAGVTTVTDAFLHDPAVAGQDGGLTVTGGGTVQLGYAEGGYARSNPVYTHTGTTTVTGSTTLRLDTAGGTPAEPTPGTDDLPGSGPPGPGPFPNTRFVIAAGSTLAVAAADAVVGETGTTPVTLNGGTLTLVGGTSAHLATVTLNGGTLTADAPPTTPGTARFTFLPNGLLHATANATVTTAAVALGTNATVQADAGTTLAISSPLVDGDTLGRLTATGTGIVTLSGASTYTGPTNVTAGTVTLTPVGSLAGTTSVSVAAGAVLNLNGTVTSAPTLAVAGTVAIGPAAARSVRPFGAVSVATTGTLSLTPSAASVNRTLLAVPSLMIAAGGKLDLGNGDLDVSASTNADATLTAVTAAAASGYAGGTWAGPGLTSTTAAADPRHLTAVGVIRNVGPDGTTPLYATFDGRPVTAADVLARYTLYGDTNLDGSVNAADYGRTDAGAILHLTGWANGDFNYDGVVDGSDYALLDNAFNQQAGTVATPAARVANGVRVTGSAVVPEPVSAALGAALWALLSIRRRPKTRLARQTT